MDPAAVNLTGQQSEEAFAAGTAAFILRGGPSSFGSYSNPQTSKVSKDTIAGYLVGPTGPGAGVFGLPESVGVPAASTNKCAAAMFLAWWAETPQEVWRYTGPNGSIFPAQGEAAKQVLAGRAIRPRQSRSRMSFRTSSRCSLRVRRPGTRNSRTTPPRSSRRSRSVTPPSQDGLNTLADQTKSLICPVASRGWFDAIRWQTCPPPPSRRARRIQGVRSSAAGERPLEPRYLPYVFIAASVVVIAVFNILPLAFALWDSVHKDSPLAPDHGFIGLQNYVEVLSDPAFQNAMANTLKYLLLTVVASSGWVCRPPSGCGPSGSVGTC